MGMVERVRELPAEWVKLNLGCNFNPQPGWVNVDIQELPGVDVVCDLNDPWPWEDSSVDYIRAYDIVEHLREPVHTMNEAWRVLRPGGLFEVWVPSTDGRGAFQDPTHVSFWNQNSFLYYSQRNMAGIYPGLIKCDFNVILSDTPANAQGVIWTWAFCRVVKGEGVDPAVSDAWMQALIGGTEEARTVPGYRGNTMGTQPVLVEEPDHG